MDLVRDLLLKIADAHEPAALSEMYLPGSYHMRMLVNHAGLVSGRDVSSGDGEDWMSLELTWTGNDFIDAARDPTVWAKVKEGAQRAGSASWEIVLGLCKAYAKQLVKERLGIDL